MLRARATHTLCGLGWTEIESNVGREQACIFEKVDDAESSGSVVDARFATAILNVMTLFEVALALLLRLSWGSRAAIQRGKVLQRRSRGEVNPEPIPPALIASRHLGRHMSELLLRIELVNLSRGGEAGSN